jgi:hypothetical protein
MYIRVPGTQVCDFCGAKEQETIDADRLRVDPPGWATLEWGGEPREYITKDLCPKCFATALRSVTELIDYLKDWNSTDNPA